MKTVDYNMLTRIQEKIWKVAHGGLLGLFLDRGMEKLVLYPQYLLYGAGEGGFDRFTLTSQINEIHCCLFSVLFCYGIIPTVFLLIWLVPESAVYECGDDVCGGRDFGGEFLFGELPAADVLDDFGVWECDKGEGE